MLIIFSVNDQKITHDLKGQLVAGSVDIVQAAFKFDSSWDELDKIVVFTSSACPKPVPVQFADEAFYIPKDVLKPGKLYVSVVGFGLDGRKKTTQKWDDRYSLTELSVRWRFKRSPLESLIPIRTSANYEWFFYCIDKVLGIYEYENLSF